jgi:hypothetical protein
VNNRIFPPSSKAASKAVASINKVKQIDRWSRTPKSIQDRLALEAAKKGAGERIMQGTPLKDPRFIHLKDLL